MSSPARAYALVVTVLLFFLAWATIAARPWASVNPTTAAQAPALTAREQQLTAEAARVQTIVDKRWATYRTALAARKRQIAKIRGQNAVVSAQVAAPQVQVQVTSSPPVTATRTS